MELHSTRSSLHPHSDSLSRYMSRSRTCFASTPPSPSGFQSCHLIHHGRCRWFRKHLPRHTQAVNAPYGPHYGCTILYFSTHEPATTEFFKVNRRVFKSATQWGRKMLPHCMTCAMEGNAMAASFAPIVRPRHRSRFASAHRVSARESQYLQPE